MKRQLSLNDKINIRGAYEKKGITSKAKIEIREVLESIYALYGMPLKSYLDLFPKKYRR